ncbi:MAG: transcriptional regulator, IclR family [Frankiales bacterium]|nr:transcriptional regulator, IclR family [Frankiales bacterium]
MPRGERLAAERAQQASTTGGEAQGLRAVTRTLDLLDVIAAATGRLDLASLARESGLHAATALRYLNSLQARGFVRHTPETGYELGAKLFELGSAFAQRSSMAVEVQQPLEELAVAAQETASAGIVDEGSVLYIAIAQGQRELGIQSVAGSRHPIHCTALGKAVMAWLPWDEASVLLSLRPLVALTDKTLVHLPALRRELEHTRARGYAIDNEERNEGVLCIGAPVFDHLGRVVGAVSISGPKFRVEVRSVEVVAQLVVDTARLVSTRLGAPPV